ncbi:MAG: DHA2 family efflux MFS transporter permease subunit, partial [Pseudomonadota bacterium]
MVLTAVLEVLDMTIVNVAIPHMLGAFAATADQITWILTSYIVAAAVVMPLTGYLSTWLGRRRLLLTAITGFVVSSALCGLAWNLESMVVFRLAQGVFGAPLVPLSQAILLDAFPRSRHGQALAIFGMGIMVAPVIGPALGGYLTETYSWRMVFYINVPIGAISMAVIAVALKGMPRPDRRPVVDWAGVALFAAGVASILLGIVEAGRAGAWSRIDVVALLALGGLVLVAFVAVERRAAEPIVPLRLFKIRMIVAAVVTRLLAGMAMFGALSFVPLYLQ